MVGRSHTLSVIYDMHDQSVERGESSSQRQAQEAFFTPSSFSSLCWLPTTTPSSSRCAKRGACRSALPRPPIRISSVFVPQILRDAPLGSRAKRRTAASSARKSRRKIGCGGQLDLRIQNTRPLRHRGRLACTRSLERRTAGCVLFVTCYLLRIKI